MKHTPRAILAKILTPLSATLLVLLAAIATSATPQVAARQPHRVALVVHFDDTTLTRCVTFDEPELSGYDVLARSGLPFIASFDTGPGAAICKIEGVGCPAENCLLCRAPLYWSYWRFDNGDWVYSQLGASATTVRDGDTEGWSWGNGDPPPRVPYDEICAPPAPTATPAPPTATPTTPPPTATPPPLPEAWFRFDANPVTAGSCTRVRCDTANTQSAYLDGEAVPLSGDREVCPSTDLRMTLRIVNEYGEQSYTLALGVVTLAATATPPPTSAPQSQTTTASTPLPPATATPRPTATSAPLPAAPSPTPSASPTTTPTPVPASAKAAPLPTLPTATPTRPPISPPTPLAASSTRATLPGYMAFGLLTGGLLIGLGWRGLRQR